MSSRLDDGFSTIISLVNKPTIKLYEKELTPPGISAGGAIDTTTMRNTAWRTMAPRNLKTLSPITVTVAYATEAVYQDVLANIGINQAITVTFADTSTLLFYGWIEEFTPGAATEGEQPTATMTIQPSNRHSTTHAETAPVYTDNES